jgi:hypothetical protein
MAVLTAGVACFLIGEGILRDESSLLRLDFGHRSAV